MHTRTIRIFTLCGLLASLTIPLAAQSLEDIVTKALGQSSQIQNLEITKTNALLSLDIAQADETVDIAVTTGDITAAYDTTSSTYVFSTTGAGATFILPDDGETTISVSSGNVYYTASGNAYAASPEISVDHTFVYGYTDDYRSDIVNAQSKVVAVNTYETSKLNFTGTIYTQISSLLANEQSIKQTQKDIDDLKRDLDQSLKLKLLDEGSISYQSKQQEIAKNEATLTGLQASRGLLLKQFATITEFTWEGVDAIKEPKLDFSSKADGNSSVKIKELDLALAKEDLALKLAELNNKNLKVGGSLSYAKTNDTSLYTSYSTTDALDSSLSATLSSKQFSVTAKLNGNYDMVANDFTPSVTVGGSWNNNPTNKADNLMVQQLQNEVLLAQLEYNSALTDYQQSAISLENDIASWKLTYTLLKQTMEYNKQLLAQQKQLFSQGLAAQADVDDASFTVEMDSYDLATTLLDGLALENEINILQL